jgi:hypothetical protein
MESTQNKSKFSIVNIACTPEHLARDLGKLLGATDDTLFDNNQLRAFLFGFKRSQRSQLVHQICSDLSLQEAAILAGQCFNEAGMLCRLGRHARFNFAQTLGQMVLAHIQKRDTQSALLAR